MQAAMEKKLIAGGVVLVGGAKKTYFSRAYGKVSPAGDAKEVAVDTIFDLASLTKVIATTPSILKLAEERKLSLVDPLKKWLVEFEGKGRDELLLLNLLTHTSALNDMPLNPASPMQSAIAAAAAQTLKGEIGSRFHYADINFILLGEVVRRTTGQTLDEYALKSFYQPLGMKDTCFRPPKEKMSRIASTAGDTILITGEVQDYVARQLGGVAGHAGLFSTAGDLALFCRMLLGGGEVDGVRVLEQRTVSQMTAPYFSRGGRVIRGLGWDIASPYSAPRGNFFSRGSFGHTGYSGTSVWVDPEADIFVILLTTRLDYRNKSEFSQLRSELSTLAVEAFGSPQLLKELEEE
ncbi:MAG: beta-lactamase family protein [Geobacter sp.]|nr:beta-lactamase family protein [Geobacter sp.]